MLPNGSHLSFGSYQEESRPLRRLLKQVGGGSIQGGLLAVQQDPNAMRELANALCIDTKVAPRSRGTLSIVLGCFGLPHSSVPGLTHARLCCVNPYMKEA